MDDIVEIKFLSLVRFSKVESIVSVQLPILSISVLGPCTVTDSGLDIIVPFL